MVLKKHRHLLKRCSGRTGTTRVLRGFWKVQTLGISEIESRSTIFGTFLEMTIPFVVRPVGGGKKKPDGN